MLSGNIEYYRPRTVEEAIRVFTRLKDEEKRPVYYSGGTEILTLGRLNLINTEAVIDIKGIKESKIFAFNQDILVMGSALTLTFIEEKNLFPLLTATSREIADRTARNKITLGGNLCGQIFYREAILPFLLCDSSVKVAGPNGMETLPIEQIFNQTFQLEEGQFILQIETEKSFLRLPFISVKKRQQWETGYPLLTIAAIKISHRLRFAFSGLCPFPFRSKQIEEELNKGNIPIEVRITRAINLLPSPLLDDVEGSKDYRIFVLRNTLKEIITELEEK